MMKIRDTLSPTSMSDLTQERSKRLRAKSPTNMTKNKQTYLLNLEKRLDELLTVSTNDKKNNMSSLGKSGLGDIGTTSKSHLPYDSYKDPKGTKKVTLCKMYAALKTCKKGDNCPFAHGYKQLDVEYKPVEWVKIFRHSSSSQGLRNGLQTANNLNNPRESSEFSRLHTSSTRFFQQTPQGPQLNKIINTKGRTLLIEATVMNDLQTVKTLVKKGSSVSQKDWLGNDSVFYAIKNSNPVILEALIRGSQDPLNLDEQFTISKFSYLILAAKMGSAKMVEILLRCGANPSVSDRYNRTALFYCVEKNFKMGVELLLAYSIDINRVDTSGKTALDLAYDKKLVDVVDILIKAGGASDDINKNKMLLSICAHYNLKDSVNELLKRGMAAHEVDENGNNMLMVAYESGNLELLEAVLKEYSLNKAINQKNKRGDNLILRSIKDGNELFTHMLLQNPSIDLNIRDEVGKTLLMYAAEAGDYETVEFLISKGVNLDSTDKYGRTALILACTNNHVLTVEVLLKQSINVLWKDYLGKSAKHCTTNSLIKGLLRHYMIEKNQLSESLIKEIEDEAYQIRDPK